MEVNGAKQLFVSL